MFCCYLLRFILCAVFFLLFFFFFQAEDGIRDAQESRGLGDVYKRQGLVIALLTSVMTWLSFTVVMATLPLF